jgi:ABC-2 type transport system permease protein
MNMDKLLVIIKREYLTRVASKGFVIGTILTPLLMASLLLLPALLMGRGARTDYRVVVLDQTGDVALYERAAGLLTAEDARNARFQMRREAVSEIQSETRRQELNREIGEGKLDSYVVIPALVLDEGKIAYHAKNIGDFIAETRVENAFNTAVIERRMTRSGLDVEQIGGLSRKIIMEKFNERGEGEDWRKIITAFLLMGILCLTVLAYGGHIMSAVIEEKQSRIIEVLLSSVEPFPLVLGKLVGVGLVGLTQYAVWAVCAVLLSGLTASQSTALGSFRLPHISASLMFFFVMFFLLGYFLYATLFVMVGGIVSNEEDGQQMQLPLMMLILLAPVASSFVWRQPDSVFAITISLFPFFTPFAMFLRIAIQQPPLWQIALSILLMIATILGAVWLAAKLYRVGVLMYGKRPTLPEMAKWLRTS